MLTNRRSAHETNTPSNKQETKMKKIGKLLTGSAVALALVGTGTLWAQQAPEGPRTEARAEEMRGMSGSMGMQGMMGGGMMGQMGSMRMGGDMGAMEGMEQCPMMQNGGMMNGAGMMQNGGMHPRPDSTR